MKQNFMNGWFLLMLTSIIQVRVLSQPTVGINGILIEMASPLWQSNQCQNGQQHLSHVQYNTYFTNVKAYGISFIGFESVVQNSIYIKSSITNFNTTHVQIQCSCQQGALFTKMKFSYIIIQNTIVFIQIYNDCFLCGDPNTTSDHRKWQFSTTQHLSPYSNDIQISSSLSAFNVSNVEGTGIYFNISTSMKTTDKFMYHTIQAWSWTIVTSVCITTIIYDFSLTNSIWAPYQIIVITQQKHINQIDQATNIQPTYYGFSDSNSMYYGISGIDIFFQKNTSQLMLFDLYYPSSLNNNFKTNLNLNDIQLSAFFIRQLDCPIGQYFDPQIYGCVFSCPQQTGPDPVTNYCQKCHQTCATCSGSGNDKCLTCNTVTLNKFRQVNSPPDQCLCKPGYIESLNGSVICLSCAEMIQNCVLCTSPTFCSLCVSPYVFNPSTNKCGCSNFSQYLSQGQCLPFPGCLTILHSTNINNYCSFCDQPNNFEFLSVNNSCRCKSNFTFSESLLKCVDLCGDGIVIDLQCDDGNTVNGDGCSSTCQKEAGYFCVDKNIQQPSLCMPMWNFTIDYLYSQRDISSNLGTFVFLLRPLQPKIANINLIQCLSFSFSSKVISYEYDLSTGQLSVKVEFNETIEGQNHDFKLNMGSAKIKTNQIKSNFNANGMNSWLIRDQYSGVYKFVIYGILVVCLLAWILTIIVSLLGYKHLAIELIFPIQSIYLVLMEQSSNAPGLRALDLMKFINGYNSMEGFKLKTISSLNDTQYWALQYLQNINFSILVNLLFIILIFILKTIHYRKQRKLNKQQSRLDLILDEQKHDLKKCKTKVEISEINQMFEERIGCQSGMISQIKQRLLSFEKIMRLLGSRFLNVIILMIIQGSIYYLGIYMIFGSEENKFSIIFNNLSCIVCAGLGLFSLWMFPGLKDNEITLTFTNEGKYSYCKIYMLWYVVFAAMLIFLQYFTLKSMVLIPVILITLITVILILKNPYQKQKSRKPRLILPIIQQIILTIPLYLLWVTGFLKMYDPLIYFITTVLIVCCCFLAIILTSVRTYFEWGYFSSIEMKSNLQAIEENQQNQKEKLSSNNNQLKNDKDYQTILKQKNSQVQNIPNDRLNTIQTNKHKLQIYQTLKNKPQKKQQSKKDQYDSISSNQDNNDQDLQFIKKRLRTELKSKRALKDK